MSLNPSTAITDLESYLANHDLKVSGSAKNILHRVEQVGYQFDWDPDDPLIILCLLEKTPSLRSVVFRNGGDPDEGIRCILHIIRERYIYNDGYNADGSKPYTNPDHKGGRSDFVHFAADIACKKGRNEILDHDLVEAILAMYEEDFSPLTNSQWNLEEFQVPFNTLSHIVQKTVSDEHQSISKCLWVKLDDIRLSLGLLPPEKLRKLATNDAPPKVRSSVYALFADHPDYLKNVFLAMSFQKTEFHKKIFDALYSNLNRHGFNLLRADQHNYSEDLLTNIEAHIYGCRFGIAVFERLAKNVYNPNVSFEVGYLIAVNKPILLLKEKKLSTMQTDLIGRLYAEFDAQDMHRTIDKAVDSWLSNQGLL